jgi:hypothetical protein
MVSKCANPECSERFMRLHQGKLFRWDGVNARPGLTRGTGLETKKARRVEFFWLCGNCAREVTIIFKEGIGVTTMPLAGSNRPAREAATKKAWRDNPPAGHSSESAASRQTYAFRHAAG